MSKPIFDFGIHQQTKQILVIAGIGLAVLAVYEFSANAGEQAGQGIGQGIGTGATVLGTGAAAALILLVLL
jgi:hypothetical protein